MNRIAGRTAVALLIAAILLAGFVFFICEYAIEARQWVIFPGSPHVYNGGNIGCGSVTDKDGVLLLDMTGDRTYADEEALRKATVHLVGDRYGSISAPALTHYASQLAGFDLLNGVYTYGQNGGTATLTVSAKVQKAALEAMSGYKGTVAVYNYKTGQLLCAVTTPTYDPDNVPELSQDAEAFEGLYYNRFTQSVYTPGSIYKIVTLAAVLEEMPELLEEKFVCNGTYAFGNDEITCEGSHFDQDLQTAFRNSCNCVFAQLIEKLGPEKLSEYVEKFRINDPISFDGITTAEGNFEVDPIMDANAAWSGIGQHKDLVNPCAFMTFMGAIAAGGKGVEPYLVEEISAGLTTTYRADTVNRSRIMSKETAERITSYLRSNVEEKYGDWNFPDLSVCAKTGTGEVGGEKKPNAMLAGFVSDERYPLAFIVCVEDGGYGSTVCLPVASQVLAACKDALS